ncbi:MAG: hypothetical protein KatS3mg009_3348 [Acidimicrobiia bacterium]|nr:MAG: hypothetical protein KatS3mg009_3348 [Acidimicrobiia bacterium]
MWAAAGLAVCAALGVWNVAHHGEHVLINRDPGVYANAGRWIASNGDLRVPPAPDAVLAVEGVTQHSFGVYVGDGGHLEFQFAHLLPALLAQAHRIGGDGLMFAVPPVLGAAALLAFFVLAWRVVRAPWAALAATAALGLTIPQVAFSRDSYSEIPTQLLAFTVVWLLADGRARTDARVMAVAGLLAGAIQAVRIDAVILLVGIPPAFAAWWLAAGRESRPVVARAAGAFTAGASIGLVVGLTDLVVRSGDYVRDLSGELRALVIAGAASVAVALAGAVIASRAPGAVARGARWAAAFAPWVVVVVGLAAWWVRPALEEVHGARSAFVEGLQRAEGLPPDGTLQYYDHSLDWMAWYHGRAGVALAIVGAAWVTRRILAARELHLLAPVAVLAPAAALYLWRAQAFQDHVWVMRRLLIGAMPLFALLAAAVVAWSATRRGVLRAVAPVAAAVLVAAPASSVWGVARMTEQPGYTRAIDPACGAFGPGAAVAVLQGDGLLHEWVPQTLRSWCGAEVVVLRGRPAAESVRAVARAFGASGRALWLVATTPEDVLAVAPGVPVAMTGVVVNEHELERTLTRRPSRYVRTDFAFAYAPYRAP